MLLCCLWRSSCGGGLGAREKFPRTDLLLLTLLLLLLLLRAQIFPIRRICQLNSTCRLLHLHPWPRLHLIISNVMASAPGCRMPPPSSSSRPVSTSLGSTPTASFKRLAKSQDGQRKQQRPREPLTRLRGHNNTPSRAAAPTADQLDAEIRAEEAEDESLDHVIMAIDIRDRDTAGCAYYIARQQSLMCMEDVIGGGKDVLDMLKLDTQPTILLVSPRIDLEGEENDLLQSPRHASVLDNGMLALRLKGSHFLTRSVQTRIRFHTASSSDQRQNLATTVRLTSSQASNHSTMSIPTYNFWSLLRLPALNLVRMLTTLVQQTAKGDCCECQHALIWRAKSVSDALEQLSHGYRGREHQSIYKMIHLPTSHIEFWK